MPGLLSLVSSSLLVVQALLAAHGTHAQSGSLDAANPIVPFVDYPGMAAASAQAVGKPLAHGQRVPKCKSIKKRIEWRKLTYGQKKDYMQSLKCLQKKPDFGISPQYPNLYDAFVWVHTTNWTDYHLNAWFMPWHRWFVWIHSEAMEKVCGYHGPVPYWNYTADYKNLLESPIFSSDPNIGFGSHGRTAVNVSGLVGYKVDNGAFANMKLNIPVNHYLTRNFSAWKTLDPTRQYGIALGESFSPAAVTRALSADKFSDLEAIIEGFDNPLHFGIHNSPHFFSMGDWTGPGWMNNTQWFPQIAVAPNDPIFWIHHAYVDQVFWSWQQKPGKQWLFNGNFPWFDPTDNSAKATDILPFYGLGPNPPVNLTLKTENWPMC